MIYDVAIIGAGPCGLAVASRLREMTPSALFTDDEHARYWKRFNRSESIENERKKARRTCASNHGAVVSQSERSLVVLDAQSSSWMSAWRERFRALHIDQLRSPLFFHPDPRDRDGLLAYSHFQDRMSELEEIPHVVGKEISKHRVKKSRHKKVGRHLRVDDRDRIDYFTPSSDLFDDFCDDIVERYHLQNLVQQARVDDITYGDIGGLAKGPLFSLNTSGGLFIARVVVLAVGPGSKPCVPHDHQLRLDLQVGSVCHCMHNPHESCLPEHVSNLIRSKAHTEVVVVGGGLTSAQICDVLIRRGVTKVWLLLRGKYKLKHFDVDLEWVSKVRNQQMSVFWSAESDQERFELLKQARNGGSITPRFDKILQKHVAQNRLAIVEQAEIREGLWDHSRQKWSLQWSQAGLDASKEIDHIIYATGVVPNIEKVACLATMQQEHPVENINGLAKITNDLMWNEQVPMFLSGGLAGLRLGPGAANLVGARQGGERIAWKIDQLLGKVGEGRGTECESGETDATAVEGVDSATRVECRSDFTGGFVNHFEALAMRET